MAVLAAFSPLCRDPLAPPACQVQACCFLTANFAYILAAVQVLPLVLIHGSQPRLPHSSSSTCGKLWRQAWRSA